MYMFFEPDCNTFYNTSKNFPFSKKNKNNSISYMKFLGFLLFVLILNFIMYK